MLLLSTNWIERPSASIPQSNYQITRLPDYSVRLSFDAEGAAAAAGRRRVGILDREPAAADRVDEVDFRAVEVSNADRIDEQLDAV